MTKKTKINILYVLASIFFVMLFFVPLGCNDNNPDDGSSEPVFAESSVEIIERELLLIGAIPANNSTDVLWETTEFELEFSEPLLISSGTAISFSDSGVSKLIPIQRVIDSGAFALSDDKKIVTLDVTQLEDHYKVLLADPDARDGDDRPVFRLKAEATFTFTFKGLGIADISETEKAIVSAGGYTYSFTVGEAQDLNPEVVAEKSSITDNVTLTLVDGIEATLTDEGGHGTNYSIVSSEFPVGVNISIGVTHPANIIGLLAMEWGGVNFSFSETINTSNHIYTSDAPIDIDAGNNDFSANVFELFFKGDSVKTKSKQLAVTGVVNYTIGDVELVTTTRSGNEVISREEMVDVNRYQVAEWTASDLQPYYTVSSWSYPLSVGMRVKVLLPDAVANQVSVRWGSHNFSYTGPVSGETGVSLYTSSTSLSLNKAVGDHSFSNQFQIYSGANREDQGRISDANRQLNIYAYETYFNDNIFTASEIGTSTAHKTARLNLLDTKCESYNNANLTKANWFVEKRSSLSSQGYGDKYVLDNNAEQNGNHNDSLFTERLYTNLVFEMEWQFAPTRIGETPQGGEWGICGPGKASEWMGWEVPSQVGIKRCTYGVNFGLFIKAHPRDVAKPDAIQSSTVEVQLAMDKVSYCRKYDWDTLRFKGQNNTSYAWGNSTSGGQRCYRAGALYDLYPWKFDNARASSSAYDSITKPDANYLFEDGAWHKVTVIVNTDRLRLYLINGNAPSYGERLAHDLSTTSDDFQNRLNASVYRGQLAHYIGYESFDKTKALRGGRMVIQRGDDGGFMYIRDVRIREL